MSLRYILISLLLATFLLLTANTARLSRDAEKLTQEMNESHRPDIVNGDDEINEIRRSIGNIGEPEAEDGDLGDENDPEGFRWLGLGKRQPRFTPYISVGVLSNMQQFFDNLKENLDALDTLPPEEKDSLLSSPSQLSTGELRRMSAGRVRNRRYGQTCRCRKEESKPIEGLPSRRSFFEERKPFGSVFDDEDCIHRPPRNENVNTPNLSTWIDEKDRHRDRAYRPTATAAYLNALRTHHPSYKIRNFVESPEQASYRGTNRYDPSLMWTGLGRRKR